MQRKALTPVVAIVLVTLLTVAAAGAAFAFTQTLLQERIEEARQQASTRLEIRHGACEPSYVKMTVKNTGNIDIAAENASLFVSQPGGELAATRVGFNVSDMDFRSSGGTDTFAALLDGVLERGTGYVVELGIGSVKVVMPCAPAQNLAAYWKMDEETGTWANDSTRNGNDGRLQNGTAEICEGGLCPQWVDGKFGNAIDLDGYNDYVEVPHDASLDVTEKITMVMWVKGRPSGDWPRLLEKGENDAYELFGGNNVGSEFRPWVRINGGSLHRGDVGPLSTNKWVHVAATYNAETGESKLYVNGSLAHTDSIPPQPVETTSKTLRFGTEEPLTDTDKWNGSIDDIRIYREVLTATDIKDLYNLR